MYTCRHAIHLALEDVSFTAHWQQGPIRRKSEIFVKAQHWQQGTLRIKSETSIREHSTKTAGSHTEHVGNFYQTAQHTDSTGPYGENRKPFLESTAH